MNFISKQTDVLVIGAGLAGLEAAWAACEEGAEVTILSKGPSASNAVLGFNAPVGDDDSAQRFACDTWEGGWRLGEQALINALCSDSATTVSHLEALGQNFEKNEDRSYHLLQPLGCSVPRLVHSANATGKISMDILRQKLLQRGVCFLNNCMAAQLLVREGRVCGAMALYTDKPEESPLCIRAGAVVLACGGGHLLKNSTYPIQQTADGFAMAYRAGADLIDLEFVQHEPCRCIWPKLLGISTTLLAKGGKLTNRNGERFVCKQYSSEAAVPKDVLARLIALEVLQGRGTEHGGVWLDLTGLPQEEIKVNHRLYYDRFLEGAGIDLTRERVEVGPGAHSMMGGVRIDEHGFTGINGLYAAGEVTGGLHGANRLGGNAGAEVYVFGRRAGTAAARGLGKTMPRDAEIHAAFDFLAIEENARHIDYEGMKRQVREVLAKAAGPVREAGTLQNAIKVLDTLLTALQEPCRACECIKRLEALNLAQTGRLICLAAYKREESRGVHYRLDYPQMQPEWQRHITWNRRDERGYSA